jgi:protein-disulfide isomerase
MDRRLFTRAAVTVTALAVARPALGDPLATPEPGDMTLGNPKAKVTVIQYASASCPHCAAFNNDVFPAFKAKYIDTGRVFYVFREFLTQPVQVAAAGFLLARCVPAPKYFQVIDAFFHAQAEMYDKNDLKGPLLAVASRFGLDPTAVDACLADQAQVDGLNARVKRYIDRDKIRATPTFLVNGKLMEGEQTLDALDAAITAAEAARRGKRG